MVNESVPVEAAYPGVVGVKTALRSSAPTGRAVVEVEAVPAVNATGLPSKVGVPDPYSNWTEPSTPDVVTVAFSVTDVPANCGLVGEAVSVVMVGIPSIVNVLVPVEGAYPAVEGLKTAPRSLVPTGSAVVVVDAAPATTVTGLPSSVGVPEPYSNWTEPATPEVVTEAFSVTEVP
jgi:hypothetical protein